MCVEQMKKKNKVRGQGTNTQRYSHTHTRTHNTGPNQMCWCNDLFQIQSVHLRRITGPDGHRMNNATPAEGQSAIRFPQKGNIGGGGNFIWHKNSKKGIQGKCSVTVVNLFRELENFSTFRPGQIHIL